MEPRQLWIGIIEDSLAAVLQQSGTLSHQNFADMRLDTIQNLIYRRRGIVQNRTSLSVTQHNKDFILSPCRYIIFQFVSEKRKIGELNWNAVNDPL
jgi:hypothetical protein